MARVIVDANGYVRTDRSTYQHRTVVESVLGRPLRGTECVHHINGDKLDNRPDNLVVCPDQSYHLLLHARQRIVDAGGNPNTQALCGACGSLKDKSEFPKYHKAWNGVFSACKMCTNNRRRGKYKKSPEQVARTNAARRNDPERWARHLEWTRQSRKRKRRLD